MQSKFFMAVIYGKKVKIFNIFLMSWGKLYSKWLDSSLQGEWKET